MRSFVNKKTIWLASGFMLALSLFTGCTVAPGPNDQASSGAAVQSADESGSSFMTYDQVVEQYIQSQPEFPLPLGREYPPFPDGYDVGGVYEQPYGTMITFGVYQCAWQSEWLDTRISDESRAGVALNVLMKIADQSVFKQTVAPDSRVYYQSLVEQAALGDPSGIQSFANANC